QLGRTNRPTPPRNQPGCNDVAICTTGRESMGDVRAKKIAPPIPVIISLRESDKEPQKGVGPAKDVVRNFLKGKKYRESEFYIFASLSPEEIEALEKLSDFVYQIWTDERCDAHLLSSVDTVKASAGWRTFEARGKGITWA